mgnify:CR=1 FL=1
MPETRLVNGVKVPEISLPLQNGAHLSLSTLQKSNKIILIDFWASWCKPCLTSFPELKKVYNKYRDLPIGNADGFTIYSVSLDNDLAKWQEVITQYELDWPHQVIDTTAFGSNYLDLYQFSQIPTSYLIDENGIIIGKNITFKWMDYELGRRAGIR